MTIDSSATKSIRKYAFTIGCVVWLMCFTYICIYHRAKSLRYCKVWTKPTNRVIILCSKFDWKFRKFVEAECVHEYEKTRSHNKSAGFVYKWHVKTTESKIILLKFEKLSWERFNGEKLRKQEAATFITYIR